MIEYTPREDDQARRDEEMRQRYRNVFGSMEGKIVLGDILVNCHFGVPLNNEVERIEYNVGITIARISGMMSEIDGLLKIGEG
jgi:hypothetical protein